MCSFLLSASLDQYAAKYNATAMGIFESFPLIVFSFMYQPNLPAVYQELKNKTYSSMWKVIIFATLIACVCYGFAGYFGYATFACNDDVKTIMEKENIFISLFFSYSVSMSLSLSLPVSHLERNVGGDIHCTAKLLLLLLLVILRTDGQCEIQKELLCVNKDKVSTGSKKNWHIMRRTDNQTIRYNMTQVLTHLMWYSINWVNTFRTVST